MDQVGSNNNSNKKKRKRCGSDNNNRNNRSTTTTSISLPDIPGVPIDVVPYFLEALKCATKYFSKSNSSYTALVTKMKKSEDTTGYGIMVDDDGNNNNNNNNNNGNEPTCSAPTISSSVHESLMNRIETATTSSSRNSDPSKEEEKERFDRMNRTLRKWLETVKRFVRSSSSSRSGDKTATGATTTTTGTGGGGTTTTKDDNNNKNSRSVPYSCFLYLWEIQQDHPRVPVRRAALFMSGPLLEKSRDCRYHLQEDNNLSIWISNLIADGTSWKNEDQARMQLPLLQKEGFQILEYLIEEGYNQYYPKLDVAKQMLLQRCHNHQLLQTTASSTTEDEDSMIILLSEEMTIRRKLRDIALEYGTKEIRTVQKLIIRCQTCLDILVPRIGININESSSSDDAKKKKKKKVDDTASFDDKESAATSTENTNNNESGGVDDDDDDDDDLDWEDGDDFGDEEIIQTTNIVPQQQVNDDHMLAVERTLATMKASGGILRDGGIEIDLARVDDDNLGIILGGGSGDGGSATVAVNPEVLSKLERHIQLLSNRHMPRLTRWLDALANADNLTMGSATSGGGALISLPSNTSSQRKDLVTQLSGLKQEASCILSSAALLQNSSKNNNGQPALDSSRDSSSTSIMPATAANAATTTTTTTNMRRPNPNFGCGAMQLAPWERQQRKKKKTARSTKHNRSNRIEIKFRK